MEEETNTQTHQISLDSSENLDESHDSASINQHFSKKISKKKIYIKLDKDQLKMLKDSFLMTQYYPKKTQIVRLAKELNIDVTKIENWLKYERRKLAKVTYLQKYKKRKRFSDEDLKYLKTAFQSNPCPNKLEMETIAKTINCSPKNIENWFGNYKKKIKNQNKSSKNTTNTGTLDHSQRSMSFLSEIKLEDTQSGEPSEINSTPKNPGFLPPAPKSSSNEADEELQNVLGFYQSLQTYMNSPEVVEMQRKNLALTQNFMIYQQLFQVYLMMNFKKRLEGPTTNTQMGQNSLEESIKTKKEENPNENPSPPVIDQDKNENIKIPIALQNMMNFLNNNFKDKNLKK